MEILTVDLGERSYPIYFSRGGFEDIGTLMQKHSFKGRVSIITNPVVGGLYAEKVISSLKDTDFFPEVIKIPDGEEYKNLNTVSSIYDSLVGSRMERISPIIALGGGVVGDIAGFAAATYLRGIPFVQVPTTLLSQVDSSVGGKTGVNHPKGKNLIGAFYQPRFVLIDTTVLKTLPHTEIRAGLAEVIKYGIIKDHNLLLFLEANYDDILKLGGGIDYAIKRSCEIKAEVVEQDEREKGLRAVLNFGHTFGHAVETLTDYREFKHGEAVAIGMVMAAALSYELGICNYGVYKRIKDIVEKFGLPVSPPPQITADKLLSAMEIDKKVIDAKLRFVLVKEIGEVVFHEIRREDFPLDLLGMV
ncbi:MAG: 3-dehydroquinate synthase [Deltaproteobacteria bacterium GWC2_42_11]|nr:MAG: 3-dehydroquinate synthase [Deltaproteobacteria bacterium GWC2_42_11]HBO85118.1 3-dehydroquinate synthase [Deltaproteobacteria bacterium]